MKIYENPSTSIKFNFECILKLLKPLLGPSSLDHPSGILWGILLVYFGVYFCPMDDAGRNHTTTGAKKASPRLGGILFFFPLAFIRNHALGVPLCGHGPSLYTLIDNRFWYWLISINRNLWATHFNLMHAVASQNNTYSLKRLMRQKSCGTVIHGPIRF